MKKTPFRFCLNTSTIRCGDLPIDEKIRVAAEAGYDGIEPWVRELDAAAAAGGAVEDVGRRAKDAGLEIVNLIGFFDWAGPDPESRRKGAEEARRSFDLARRVGATRVAAPPMGFKENAAADLDGLAASYAALIDLGREFGVVPVLEFWGHSKVLGRLSQALYVAAASGREEARVLADVFHMYKGGSPFEGLSLAGPKTVGLFHVNDYPAQPPRETITDADRVYPGDGVAPMTGILARLAAAGYRGYLSVELFNKTYWQQPAGDVAATGLAKIRACARAALG
jgi:sugar phosphate isomerase/epimerase